MWVTWPCEVCPQHVPSTLPLLYIQLYIMPSALIFSLCNCNPAPLGLYPKLFKSKTNSSILCIFHLYHIPTKSFHTHSLLIIGFLPNSIHLLKNFTTLTINGMLGTCFFFGNGSRFFFINCFFFLEFWSSPTFLSLLTYLSF